MTVDKTTSAKSIKPVFGSKLQNNPFLAKDQPDTTSNNQPPTTTKKKMTAAPSFLQKQEFAASKRASLQKMSQKVSSNPWKKKTSAAGTVPSATTRAINHNDVEGKKDISSTVSTSRLPKFTSNNKPITTNLSGPKTPLPTSTVSTKVSISSSLSSIKPAVPSSSPSPSSIKPAIPSSSPSSIKPAIPSSLPSSSPSSMKPAVSPSSPSSIKPAILPSSKTAVTVPSKSAKTTVSPSSKPAILASKNSCVIKTASSTSTSTSPSPSPSSPSSTKASLSSNSNDPRQSVSSSSSPIETATIKNSDAEDSTQANEITEASNSGNRDLQNAKRTSSVEMKNAAEKATINIDTAITENGTISDQQSTSLISEKPPNSDSLGMRLNGNDNLEMANVSSDYSIREVASTISTSTATDFATTHASLEGHRDENEWDERELSKMPTTNKRVQVNKSNPILSSSSTLSQSQPPQPSLAEAEVGQKDRGATSNDANNVFDIPLPWSQHVQEQTQQLVGFQGNDVINMNYDTFVQQLVVSHAISSSLYFPTVSFDQAEKLQKKYQESSDHIDMIGTRLLMETKAQRMILAMHKLSTHSSSSSITAPSLGSSTSSSSASLSSLYTSRTPISVGPLEEEEFDRLDQVDLLVQELIQWMHHDYSRRELYLQHLAGTLAKQCTELEQRRHSLDVSTCSSSFCDSTKKSIGINSTTIRGTTTTTTTTTTTSTAAGAAATATPSAFTSMNCTAMMRKETQWITSLRHKLNTLLANHFPSISASSPLQEASSESSLQHLHVIAPLVISSSMSTKSSSSSSSSSHASIDRLSLEDEHDLLSSNRTSMTSASMMTEEQAHHYLQYHQNMISEMTQLFQLLDQQLSRLKDDHDNPTQSAQIDDLIAKLDQENKHNQALASTVAHLKEELHEEKEKSQQLAQQVTEQKEWQDAEKNKMDQLRSKLENEKEQSLNLMKQLEDERRHGREQQQETGNKERVDQLLVDLEREREHALTLQSKLEICQVADEEKQQQLDRLCQALDNEKQQRMALETKLEQWQQHQQSLIDLYHFGNGNESDVSIEQLLEKLCRERDDAQREVAQNCVKVQQLDDERQAVVKMLETLQHDKSDTAMQISHMESQLQQLSEEHQQNLQHLHQSYGDQQRQLEEKSNDLMAKVLDAQRSESEAMHRVQTLNHQVHDLQQQCQALQQLSSNEKEKIDWEKKYHDSQERLEKAQQQFTLRESGYLLQSASLEAELEQILKEYDRLTRHITDFTAERKKYEQQISDMNQHQQRLDRQLAELQVQHLGITDSQGTTMTLRKEFRQLMTQTKLAHQQELEEEQRLRLALEEERREEKQELERLRWDRINVSVQTHFIV